MKKGKSIIEKVGMDIGQAKDLENAVANNEKYEALINYIIACDHPEVLEGSLEESEVLTNE